VILNGTEIAHAVKAGSISATYRADGPALVTLTLAVEDFRADEQTRREVSA
jgi:hypothetical protein